MILDIILVTQVELFWVHLDALSILSANLVTILVECLKILARELHHILWLIPHNFLNEVLEDSWEIVWNLDLLSCENTHLTHVCHLAFFDLTQKLLSNFKLLIKKLLQLLLTYQ